MGKGKETSEGNGKGRTNTQGGERKKEVKASGRDTRDNNDRFDSKKKAKTRTWSYVVKGLKMEDELESADLDKNKNESKATDSDNSWNESEIADSVQQIDSEGLDQLMAMTIHMQQKMRPTQRNKRSKHRSFNRKQLGLLSIQVDQGGRSAQNQKGRSKRDHTGRGVQARQSDARRS